MDCGEWGSRASDACAADEEAPVPFPSTLFTEVQCFRGHSRTGSGVGVSARSIVHHVRGRARPLEDEWLAGAIRGEGGSPHLD